MESEERVNIMGKRRKDTRNKRTFLILIQENILKIAIIFIILISIILFLYIFWLQINMEKFEANASNKKEVEKEDKIKDIKEIQNEDFKQSNNANNNTNIKLQQIIDFENTLRKIEEDEVKDFRLLNSENILFDKIKYKKSDNPDITVVLTMFNQAHCIHKALRSVQNQSLKNIEILVIIDCSNDNSRNTSTIYGRG